MAQLQTSSRSKKCGMCADSVFFISFLWESMDVSSPPLTAIDVPDQRPSIYRLNDVPVPIRTMVRHISHPQYYDTCHDGRWRKRTAPCRQAARNTKLPDSTGRPAWNAVCLGPSRAADSPWYRTRSFVTMWVRVQTIRSRRFSTLYSRPTASFLLEKSFFFWNSFTTLRIRRTPLNRKLTRFDVPVNDVLLMQVNQSGSQRWNVAGGSFFIEPFIGMRL